MRDSYFTPNLKHSPFPTTSPAATNWICFGAFHSCRRVSGDWRKMSTFHCRVGREARRWRFSQKDKMYSLPIIWKSTSAPWPVHRWYKSIPLINKDIFLDFFRCYSAFNRQRSTQPSINFWRFTELTECHWSSWAASRTSVNRMCMRCWHWDEAVEWSSVAWVYHWKCETNWTNTDGSFIKQTIMYP